MYASMDGSIAFLSMQVWTGQWEFCVCKYGPIDGSSVNASLEGLIEVLCI